MKKILLEPHKTDGNDYLLDFRDIYDYINKNSESDNKFALYISKWCEYLNRKATHNKEMAFADEDICRLGGWVAGYEAAKGYTSEHKVIDEKKAVVIAAKLYKVIIFKPYSVI